MIGGLGGFVLPIAFGALNDLTGIWTSCFMLLFALVATALVWMHVAIGRMEREVAEPELRKLTAEEFPNADYGDAFGNTRDRVVSAVKGANIPERASKLRLPEVKRPSSGSGGGPSPAEASTAVIPPDDENARLHRLERLATLHEKGVLTDEEFEAEKARLLNRDGAGA